MNYYIQGDAANADEIRVAFENKGYSDKGFTFDVNDILFFTANNKHINVCPANGWLANIIKTHPDYKELELPIQPKFKAKDRIVNKSDKSTIYRIIALHEEFRKYIVDIEHKVSYESCPWIAFEDQDDYELAPKPHYDISNFKPFNRVLVRQDDSCTWGASFFGRYAGMFMCCNNACFIQCIPYNDDTKHLLGTTDMCPEEYINW